MNDPQTVAFIGAGNMASAIIAGMLQNDYDPRHIWASSPSIESNVKLQSAQIHLTADNCEAAKNADVIVLCVKPHLLPSVCAELKSIIQSQTPLLISVAAGARIQTLQSAIEKNDIALIRAMPNIAAAVSASATGLYANANVSETQRAFSESLFRSVGSTTWVENEADLNALTAIAGSGPAYLFYVFEAMQEAAQSLGIDKNQAKLLIAETAIGAAKMALESTEDFEKLRAFVTSPNGTTQAATDVLTNRKMKTCFIEAIQAAYQRAKELSE